MSSIAIRIPNGLKREMARLKINWSQYLRESIRQALESEKKKEILRHIHKLLRPQHPARKGTAAGIIRSLRDHA